MEWKPLPASSITEAIKADSEFIKKFSDVCCLKQLKGEPISYATFASRVLSLATTVQAVCEVNCNPKIVALILPRSPGLVVAQAAVHLAGHTFMPLDPEWPTERVQRILQETNASLIIKTEKYTLTAKHDDDNDNDNNNNDDNKELDVSNIPTMDITESGLTLEPATSRSLVEVEPAEIMYIMFTSGSTGKPKGVQIYTEGLYTMLTWRATVCSLQEGDVFLYNSTCTFDGSILEIWLPIVAGITCFIMDDGLHLDPTSLHQVLKDGGVTVAEFVPSTLMVYLANAPKGLLPDLRLIVCAGEALKKEHRQKLTEVHGTSVKLINCYGPTEATIDVTYFMCPDDTGADDKEEFSNGYPIGWVPPGVQVHITDPQDPTKKFGVGQKGEICVSGPQVAKGYLGREDLTKDRFVPCPWDNSGRGMMYRTGDIGCFNKETGWVEYYGRMDRQIKIAGVRMELGEIESVAKMLFQDRLEAVFVFFLGGILVGVMVHGKDNNKTKTPTEIEMRKGLASKLPSVYIPSEWHLMDVSEVPLTSAGKMDMKGVEKWVRVQRTVTAWEHLYDEWYEDGSSSAGENSDPTMNWAGYFNSFSPTKLDLHSREVIHEWVMETAYWTLRHAELWAGKASEASVLEMGCGKGMIFLKVAPHVKKAVAGDVSGRAVQHVQEIWDGYMKENNKHGLCQDLKLVKCHAAEFERLPSHIPSYHVILQNGVSMHLPSFGYLLTFLNGAAEHITESGGAVLLGDNMSLHHTPYFALRKLKCRGSSAEEARQKAVTTVENEKDRLYDYRAFHMMLFSGMLSERVSAVEVQLKRGVHDSEFTGYRYDVALYCPPPEVKNMDLDGFRVKVVHDFGQDANQTIDGISTKSVVELLSKSLETAVGSDENVVIGCLGVPNQRLYSDYLLGSRRDDNISFAVETLGVKPEQLRSELMKAFPSCHPVVTWSRETGVAREFDFEDRSLSRMDVFLVLNRESVQAKIGGLRAISRHVLARHESLHREFKEADSTKQREKLEQLTNVVKSIGDGAKQESSGNLDAAKDQAIMKLQDGNHKAAIEILMATAMGMSHEAFRKMLQDTHNINYPEAGGNSFQAMRLITLLRNTLSVTPSVFDMLTKPLASVISEAAQTLASQKGSDGVGEWIGFNKLCGIDGAFDEDNAPIVVMFPTGGGSAKIFAYTYSKLRERVANESSTGVMVCLAHAAGREHRAGETPVTKWPEIVKLYCDALHPLILDSSASRRVIVCGDSLGTLIGWSVIHELHRRSGDNKWWPSTMLVSGCHAPIHAVNEGALGTSDPRSVFDPTLTDETYVWYLNKGNSGRNEKFTLDDKETIEALRSDSILYETYERDGSIGKMGTTHGIIVHGATDPLIEPPLVLEWGDEFNSYEKYAIAETGHPVYADAPDEMSALLMKCAFDFEVNESRLLPYDN